MLLPVGAKEISLHRSPVSDLFLGLCPVDLPSPASSDPSIFGSGSYLPEGRFIAQKSSHPDQFEKVEPKDHN